MLKTIISFFAGNCLISAIIAFIYAFIASFAVNFISNKVFCRDISFWGDFVVGFLLVDLQFQPQLFVGYFVCLALTLISFVKNGIPNDNYSS